MEFAGNGSLLRSARNVGRSASAPRTMSVSIQDGWQTPTLMPRWATSCFVTSASDSAPALLALYDARPARLANEASDATTSA